jgi:hypothetical protein
MTKMRVSQRQHHIQVRKPDNRKRKERIKLHALVENCIEQGNKDATLTFMVLEGTWS